jgi:hypothetical protein
MSESEFETAFSRLRELITLGRNRRLSDDERKELEATASKLTGELRKHNDD